MEQINIFEILREKYKITKPIKLIELFAGYGSQALALKYLGIDFTHHKTCEWAIKSIQAYKDIHFKENDVDYSKELNKEQLVNYLVDKGVSINYNEPAKKSQLLRKKEKDLKKIYNNIQCNNNLVNIQKVKGKDLEIINTNQYEYIMTYSFPCQDLSLAGKRQGMEDTSTRSGMLWEVERLLKECNELGELPQILLMENVPEVIGIKNVKHFNKWQLELEKLGYSNYHQNLIATDYGIPQTRNRTFMISILGEYNYTFPTKIPLKLKLKDMLEDNIDEKYYLSDKNIEQIQSWNAYEKPLENMANNEKKGICPTITTRSGDFTSSMILVKDTPNYIEWKEKGKLDMDCRAWKNIGPTLHTKCGNTKILIPEATKKGYAEATEGDGVYINRPHQKRGVVQKEKIQTLKTGQDVGVVVNDKRKFCNRLIKDNLVQEFDVIKHSYTANRENNWDKRLVEKNNESPTLDTRCDCLGVVVGTYQYSKSNNFMQGKSRFKKGKEVADTLQTTDKEGVVVLGHYNNSKHEASRILSVNGFAPTFKSNHGTINAIYNNLRIRKLTPKECFRLMGVKDEDFENCSKNQSNASLYHLAGDSIVVNVLMAIFEQLF